MKILICTLLWCCTKGDAFQEFSYARFAHAKRCATRDAIPRICKCRHLCNVVHYFPTMKDRSFYADYDQPYEASKLWGSSKIWRSRNPFRIQIQDYCHCDWKTQHPCFHRITGMVKKAKLLLARLSSSSSSQRRREGHDVQWTIKAFFCLLLP